MSNSTNGATVEAEWHDRAVRFADAVRAASIGRRRTPANARLTVHRTTLMAATDDLVERPRRRCRRWRPIGTRRRVLSASHEPVVRNLGRRSRAGRCLAAHVGVAAALLPRAMELAPWASHAGRDVVLSDAGRGAGVPRGLRGAVRAPDRATRAGLQRPAGRRAPPGHRGHGRMDRPRRGERDRHLGGA